MDQTVGVLELSWELSALILLRHLYHREQAFLDDLHAAEGELPGRICSVGISFRMSHSTRRGSSLDPDLVIR